MSVLSLFIKAKEYRERYETLVQLRSMTDRSLIDCNLSPELVREGMKGWPWQYPAQPVGRNPFQHIAQTTPLTHSVEQGIKQSVVKEDQAVALAQQESLGRDNHRTAA